MSDDQQPTTRRNVLKAVGIGATAAGIASPASASDVAVTSGEVTDADRIVESLDDVGTSETCTHEYTETRCVETRCGGNYYTEEYRKCQDCESGTTCTSWSETGDCCLY
jgi:hypothetical protein